MKIRNGFVSNSSSSSFVVVFPRIPKDANDVKNMLFYEDQTTYSYYDDTYSVEEVSSTIWSDICDQKMNDYEKAIEIVSGGRLDGSPDYDNFKHIVDTNERWEKYNLAQDAFAKKTIKEFFNLRKIKLEVIDGKKSSDAALYCFNYSDNDGEYYSALEHGGLFSKLKHIEINQH